MKVPLLDLPAQYATIKAELDQAVAEVVATQQFIMGPSVQGCEQALAKYCRCTHALGVSSGTDALLLALMAEGIGAGDEVITSPYTFFATGGSIARLGAKPVFVDIDPVTFNLNVARVEAKITPRTKAIMPVHLYGQMADMKAVLVLAKKHHLCVIEDAAQAIGAEDQAGRAGALGDYGCFSFFPTKNLGGFGDGGLVTTQNDERAEKLAILRVHGMKPKYYHQAIGGNFRLDSLQAAVLTVKLKYLDGWTAARQANAKRYDQLFAQAGLAGAEKVVLPRAGAGRHVFNQYIIRTPRRDELHMWLKEHDVATEIYYPVPLHLQECFRYLGHQAGDFPESEKAAKETLALPIYPELSAAQAARVVEVIGDFYRR